MLSLSRTRGSESERAAEEEEEEEGILAAEETDAKDEAGTATTGARTTGRAGEKV